MILGGLLLQSHLRERNVSVGTFAKRIGTTERHLWRIIKGERNCPTHLAQAIEREAGVMIPAWKLARKYPEKRHARKQR